MLISDGAERTPAHDRGLASALAFVAGALNAAGFEAVGVFSANMTGNASAAAGRLALGDLLTGVFYFAVFATFVSGAAASSLFVAIGKRRRLRTIHAVAVAVEAFGLAALGLAELPATHGPRRATLAFGLSFLLGFQNAIVTRISGARVRTTHVSGMATDIGVGVGALLELVVRPDGKAEARAIRSGLRLHLGTVLSFCLGGAVGVVVYRALGAGLLFGASAALLALSLPYAVGRSAKAP